jgi:hypothetical protein
LIAGFEVRPPIPTPIGSWTLDPSSMAVIGMAPTDSRGLALFRFAVDLPLGTLIALQAGVLLPDSSAITTLPSRTAVDSVLVSSER